VLLSASVTESSPNSDNEATGDPSASLYKDSLSELFSQAMCDVDHKSDVDTDDNITLAPFFESFNAEAAAAEAAAAAADMDIGLGTFDNDWDLLTGSGDGSRDDTMVANPGDFFLLVIKLAGAMVDGRSEAALFVRRFEVGFRSAG
jgi:hypothetical protein